LGAARKPTATWPIIANRRRLNWLVEVLC
jgi:hypothetical protein